MREKLLACKALWTEDEAEFHGEHVSFGPAWAWPKPVQRPHPPIVFGASPTKRHFEQIIELGDVWMPIEGRFEIEESWKQLLAGRRGGRARPVHAAPRRVRRQARPAHLAHLAEIGASWVALGLPALDRDDALTTMDRYARAASA